MFIEIFTYSSHFLGHTLFVLGGQAAGKYAGPSVIISFVIGAIVSFLSALSMSEMSSIMSSSGSAYTYAYVGKLLILSFYVYFQLNLFFFNIHYSSGRYVESMKSLQKLIINHNFL